MKASTIVIIVILLFGLVMCTSVLTKRTSDFSQSASTQKSTPNTDLDTQKTKAHFDKEGYDKALNEINQGKNVFLSYTLNTDTDPPVISALTINSEFWDHISQRQKAEFILVQYQLFKKFNPEAITIIIQSQSGLKLAEYNSYDSAPEIYY